MKKLLAMYICVSALVYGFNAKASGLDMPPLDNSHTQFSLVPESVFDNSSSFQMARTYFMPDYQRNLVGKQFGGRVNDGGSMGNELNCQKYGYASECLSKKGTQIQVISGLKCWKDCQPLSCADAGYVNSCPSLLTGTSVSLADGTICYTGCRCPSEYKYFKDIANSFKCSLKGTACQEAKDYRGSCPGCPKYKECTCSADYKYVKPETANLNINNIVRTRCHPPKSVGGATCQTYISVTSGGSTHTEAITMYKECNCPEGQEYKNGQCVKIENCDAYPLTGTCPAGCNCTPCPDNGNKYKIDSAKTSEGWSWTSGQTTCPATPCPAGFEAGVEKCSDTQKYTYSSSPKDKSGGKVCGKCTAKNDDCPTNYWNSCAPQHIETGVPQYTEAGTRCTQCRTRKCEEYAPTGTYKTSQPTDYKCTKVNPLGTGASYSVTCYKDCKSDICTSGYSKTACTSSQKQVGTTTTAAGSTCYKCEDIVQEEKCIGCHYCEMACPFDVPKYYGPDQKIDKCTMCWDRLENGMLPACVKTCQPGALHFGPREEMIALGKKRVEFLKARGYDKAELYGENECGGLHILQVCKYGAEAQGLKKGVEPSALVSLSKLAQPAAGLAAAATVAGLAVSFVAALGYRRKNRTVEEAKVHWTEAQRKEGAKLVKDRLKEDAEQDKADNAGK